MLSCYGGHCSNVIRKVPRVLKGNGVLLSILHRNKRPGIDLVSCSYACRKCACHKVKFLPMADVERGRAGNVCQ